MVSLTPRPLFTPGKDTVRIVEEAGWTPGPVWTGVENLAHTGIRSPDPPARTLGTALQVGRSRVRFRMVSLENFSLTKSFRPHYGPGVDSASKRDEYQEYFWEGKGGR